MAIAKPRTMPETIFHQCVDSVVNWFGQLNPYDFKELDP